MHTNTNTQAQTQTQIHTASDKGTISDSLSQKYGAGVYYKKTVFEILDAIIADEAGAQAAILETPVAAVSLCVSVCVAVCVSVYLSVSVSVSVCLSVSVCDI